MKFLRACTLFLIIVLSHPFSSYSQTNRLQSEYDQIRGFGGALAIGEGEIYVGSSSLNRFYRIKGQPGTVYVFAPDENNSWNERGRLTASDGILGDKFGAALDSKDSTLLVGAPGQGSGAAYVLEKSASGEWIETERLTIDATLPTDAYAQQVSIADNFALVSASGRSEGAGVVYVFQKKEGNWRFHSEVLPADSEAGDGFGSNILSDGTRVFINAPGKNERKGGVYIFRYHPSSDEWLEEAMLVSDDGGERPGFGASMASDSDDLFVGAPGYNGSGAVLRFRQEGETWKQTETLLPFTEMKNSGFGVTLGVTEYALLIGEVFNAEGGAVYSYETGVSGSTWKRVNRITKELMGWSYGFGVDLAAKGDVFVVGAQEADYEEGNAFIFQFDRATRTWNESKKLAGEIERISSHVGEQINCEDGAAYAFNCEGVDLVSFISVSDISTSRGVNMNDLWGWTDSETGKEYVLAGRNDGTVFLDISDPSSPVYVGELPKTASSPGSTWRDIKVYEDHAFIVADAAGQHGMQVFDLQQLRDVDPAKMPITFSESTRYDGIHSAHNIVINEDTGFAYAVGSSSGGTTCGGGLHMIDIQEPLNPTFAGCFADESTGWSNTGYTHDAQCVIYKGPDTEHQGKEICFNANETALSIADVTDKENPIAISSAGYPNVGYMHQGWLTEDHRYFFTNDELDELQDKVSNTRTLIWNVEDLDDPQLAKEFLLSTTASDHNLYIRDNFMYQSNYISGLRVLDITDVENPKEIGYFDTVPLGEDVPSWGGSWSNYPFFKSGIIAVTSNTEGVFLLRKSEVDL